MAKVFTITEGLENLGALRTGGQGSIYKGKRIGEIITAVKLLPTPIQTESNDDKNFRDFQNEVEKLKKVNEEPNPNVVKILNFGITESGSFPFIEMEFIEGPDLEDLLKPPHDPIFTLKEAIKVADQLANALSHCHKVSVKHGDIKSNNVKFNVNTGNYILLDFGLAIMSDEQRRTSLRHAGAVEFMAPEQNEGLMLFQSDVYGFGIILYELLAGIVPFPLTGNGQTARNTVMISHMEMPVPDILELRKQHLPENWPDEKKEREMQIPLWLLHIIAKCLEKNADDRFKNGIELHEAILQGSSANRSGEDDDGSVLQSENERLQTLLLQQQNSTNEKDQQIVFLKDIIAQREKELNSLKSNDTYSSSENKKSVNVSKPAFFALLLMIAFLGAFATYSLISGKGTTANSSAKDTTAVSDTDTTTNENNQAIIKKIIDADIKNTGIQNDSLDPSGTETTTDTEAQNDPVDLTEAAEKSNDVGRQFTLTVNKTYFHTEPDANTRRNAFINHWNNAKLTALNDKNGFIYVVYQNDEGQVTDGWLLKEDLKLIGE